MNNSNGESRASFVTASEKAPTRAKILIGSPGNGARLTDRIGHLSALHFACQDGFQLESRKAGNFVLKQLLASHDKPAQARASARIGRYTKEVNTPSKLFNRIAARTARMALRPLKDAGDAENQAFLGLIGVKIQLVVASPLFEQMSMLLIIANCISLAMYNPVAAPDSKARVHLELAEVVFNALFTLEMVLRVVAQGSLWTYLKSPWNVFDALMVLVGYSQFVPTGSASTGGFRAIRAVRAMRPLRTITRFSSLRAILVCFIEAVPLLATLTLFLLFLFFLFALGGMLLFQEAYHNACTEQLTNDTLYTVPGTVRACGWRSCPLGFTCQQSAVAYPSSAPGFDNIWLAMLTVFQVTTISGWSYVMYMVQDSVHPASVIYFVAIIFLCSYFVINLFLAVLKRKFGSAQRFLQSSSSGIGKIESNISVRHHCPVSTRF